MMYVYMYITVCKQIVIIYICSNEYRSSYENRFSFYNSFTVHVHHYIGEHNRLVTYT